MDTHFVFHFQPSGLFIPNHFPAACVSSGTVACTNNGFPGGVRGQRHRRPAAALLPTRANDIYPVERSPRMSEPSPQGVPAALGRRDVRPGFGVDLFLRKTRELRQPRSRRPPRLARAGGGPEAQEAPRVPGWGIKSWPARTPAHLIEVLIQGGP